MFNCGAGAVKKWKRLVAWFLSYGVNCIVNAECNFSRKHDVFVVNFIVAVYMYYCVM